MGDTGEVVDMCATCATRATRATRATCATNRLLPAVGGDRHACGAAVAERARRPLQRQEHDGGEAARAVYQWQKTQQYIFYLASIYKNICVVRTALDSIRQNLACAAQTHRPKLQGDEK